MGEADLVVAKTFANQIEADVARSALEAAGIPSMIKADTAGGMRPHLGWSGAGFQLLVRKEDATDAFKVLEPVQGRE